MIEKAREIHENIVIENDLNEFKKQIEILKSDNDHLRNEHETLMKVLIRIKNVIFEALLETQFPSEYDSIRYDRKHNFLNLIDEILTSSTVNCGIREQNVSMPLLKYENGYLGFVPHPKLKVKQVQRGQECVKTRSLPDVTFDLSSLDSLNTICEQIFQIDLSSFRNKLS